MPIFKNTSGSLLSIVHNGRKIKIERGARIEGPPHFKLYKGLTLDENVPVLPPVVTQSKLRPIVASAAHSESNQKRVDNCKDYIASYKVTGLPSIGICILTKNHLDLIRDCCESIFQQVKYQNTKIYIFDTGTTQKEVLEYYQTLSGRSIPVEFVNMNYFHFSKNYNEGISKVDTDYIVIQNNDTVALNDYVSRLMKVAVVGNVGACGPRMLYRNGKIQHDGQIIFNPDGTMAHPGHVNLGAENNTPTGRWTVNGITGAGLFIRTSLYKKIGGFDENFKDIYQDVHFNIKLKSLGYTNVCDRDAQIYHYDNTSRKELWSDKSESGKMAQDSKYLYGNLITRDIALKNAGVEKHYDFSIITLVNNKEQYANFLNDIKAQKFTGSYEVIALPNFNNEYQSCAEALNIGKDISNSKFCIYCHQDLAVPVNWLENIAGHIRDLDVAKVGFLGMAGTTKSGDGPNSNSEGACYLSDVVSSPRGFESLASMFRRGLGKRAEVQTLDELCIIGRRTLPLRFDEVTFDHYHWYGADICLQALAAGLKNYAIDAECLHISDGIGNFRKEIHREKFKEGSIRLFNKWKAKFSYFRTTTTGFSVPRNEIQFLFTKQLMEKHNIPMAEVIKP